ncbi:MAG: PleD family two-component system response regulator [Paracoccaceae bacterium]
MPGRVLIVEDSGTNRMILRARLNKAYYDVVEAEDGETALELAISEKPDLVLLDVMLPGIDGFEVCRKLKADPATLHVPVVMLTALDKQEDRVEGLEAGADDFLSKPFEDLALMSRVASLIRMKMMVDEMILRDQTSSGVAEREMLAAARAVVFPDSQLVIVSSAEERAAQMREALARNIRCRIEIATSVEEANSVVEFMGVDAVLVDEGLTAHDALRFGSVLRARPETRQAATLLVIPDNDLILADKALEIGFSDYISGPVDVLELTTRVRSLLRRKHYADQLRENMRNNMVQAVTDSLTGTYNRRYANLHLDALIEQARERDSGLAVMILDLDRFKSVNDTYGHAAGDMVLKEFARRLQENVRGVDLVARMGGEEFMVVMPEVSTELAAEIAERVRSTTADPAFKISQDGEILTVTVSIGFAVLQKTETVFEIVKRADAALYESKNGGRNRVTLAQAA